jgi:hypothetical protein
MPAHDSLELRVRLRDIIVHELEWNPSDAERLADVAMRRWRGFPRRSKANKRSLELRCQDLIQGLRQGSPIDLIYLAPGDFERLAPRLCEALNSDDQP